MYPRVVFSTTGVLILDMQTKAQRHFKESNPILTHSHRSTRQYFFEGTTLIREDKGKRMSIDLEDIDEVEKAIERYNRMDQPFFKALEKQVDQEDPFDGIAMEFDSIVEEVVLKPQPISLNICIEQENSFLIHLGFKQRQ